VKACSVLVVLCSLLLVLPILADNPHVPGGTVVVAKQSFLNQTGPIPNTTLLTPAVDGDFRMSIYLEASSFSAPAPNNEVNVVGQWTDDFRAVCNGIDVTGPVATVDYSTSFVMHAKANVPILVYSGPTACDGGRTTDTTDSYNVFVTLESLP